jgi:hypothetical protein
MNEQPLTHEEIIALATYNAEIARGLVHTELWQEKMRNLQRIFDETHRGFQQLGRF